MVAWSIPAVTGLACILSGLLAQRMITIKQRAPSSSEFVGLMRAGVFCSYTLLTAYIQKSLVWLPENPSGNLFANDTQLFRADRRRCCGPIPNFRPVLLNIEFKFGGEGWWEHRQHIIFHFASPTEDEVEFVI